MDIAEDGMWSCQRDCVVMWLLRRHVPYPPQVSGRGEGSADVPHEGITRTEEHVEEKARDEGTRRLGSLDEGSAGDGCCCTRLCMKVDLALQMTKA